MTQVVVLVLAVLIGVIAGLRALTAPAVVAWGAFLGWIDVDGKWSEWVAHPITVTVLTIFLLVELITDCDGHCRVASCQIGQALAARGDHAAQESNGDRRRLRLTATPSRRRTNAQTIR